MAELHGIGDAFKGQDAQGFNSSVSAVSTSSHFVQPSDVSSHTSISLNSAICAPPSTHDTTKSQHHMKHLDQFVADLQLSAQRAFPNSTYSRYKEVQVLLIRWEEDELEVELELDKLHSVFRDSYGFATEQFLIPTQNSHRKLNHKALSFVEEHEKEDVLLIVYYAGHGLMNKARQSTWSCKADTAYATVEWSAIQTLFEMASCDALLLLDCCAGASAAPLTERPTNIKETIAACGFETWTPSPGPQSFTNTLIEVMKEWATQLPFSAAMLHSEILTRLKHAQPLRCSYGGAQNESRKTPAYIVSTPDARTASITLGRLCDDHDGYSAAGSSSQAIPGSLAQNLSERVQSDSHVTSEDRLETLLAMADDTLGARIGAGQRKAPHVLLTVALEEGQVLDAESCARWLKQFPLLARYVSVEAVYRSYSTLLLLSVPVVLWDLLPDHAATQFVGYVQSCNLAPRHMLQGAASLPIPIRSSNITNDNGNSGNSSNSRSSNNSDVFSARDSARSGCSASTSLDCTSPLRSVSGLSSLDSGYDSSVPRTSGLVVTTSRRGGGQWQSMGEFGRFAPIKARANKRRTKGGSGNGNNNSISSVAGLLGRSRGTADAVSSPAGLPHPGVVPALTKVVRRLVVTVGEVDLNQDSSDLTCVLCYGHRIQESAQSSQRTPKPVWNKEFQFDMHCSPMYYHLRVAVWGPQMSELIGETTLDLRGLVRENTLPELDMLQSLRKDGAVIGLIRLELASFVSTKDEQQPGADNAATLPAGEPGLSGQGDEGRARIGVGDDFRVW